MFRSLSKCSKNPPAKDWLVFRGNYQGWSYSSLDQINRDNVQHLQLVWQWAMNDSVHQTSPSSTTAFFI